MNKKGQAAITDALIFLSIVGVVSTMIITSAMNYGTSIMNQVQDNYETTYLDAVLRTFYVVNYGRDGKDFIDTNTNDFIMTLIKEQYSTGNITDTTKKSIFEVLDNLFLMFPQKSYMLAIISKETTDKPIFVGIKTYAETDSGLQKVYLDCKTTEVIKNITSYLSMHNLDQRITSAKAHFYKNLIGNDKITKIEALIILSMWTSVPDFKGEVSEGEKAEDLTINDMLQSNIIKDLNCKVLMVKE